MIYPDELSFLLSSIVYGDDIVCAFVTRGLDDSFCDCCIGSYTCLYCASNSSSP